MLTFFFTSSVKREALIIFQQVKI